MDGVKLIARNEEAVREALMNGQVQHLDTASEEITDEFLLFAIESGLLAKWAEAFPDPRAWSEISFEVLLASQLTARFAAVYSQRKTGYVLRSARVLGALGYSVEVLEPGDGLSGHGTQDDKLYSGDVLRKLFGKMERDAKVSDEDKAAAVPGGAKVKVRKRASRRGVKKAGENELEAAGRSAAVGREMMSWYNTSVGESLLDYAQTGEGRRIHLLDTTKIEVELEAGTYECSGVVKDEDGALQRGYKVGTLRTLLDNAGILTQVRVGQIQTHDNKLCAPILRESKVLRAGDLVINDRGFVDGEEITHLKVERGVDVIVPLRKDMLSYEEAVALACAAKRWNAHPTRDKQEIAFIEGVEHVWDECEAPLNACVIRDWNQEKDCWEYIVLVTTDLKLSARQIVRHYELRPEIEQDYEQLKSGGWLLQKLTTTRYSQIVFYLLMVVLAYSLYQLFANTQAGAKFAGKTRQAIAFEQLRTRRTQVIVYAGGYFEIFETLTFVHLVLNLLPEVQAHLRHWLEQHWEQVRKQE